MKPLCSLASHVLKKDDYSDILEQKGTSIEVPLVLVILETISGTLSSMINFPAVF